MFKRIVTSWALAFLVTLVGIAEGDAEGLLDGRAFSGMIGPIESPDLEDSLYFDDGHFWSDICTRCGFVPGAYHAEEIAEGVRFSGTLESDSRGRFDYVGLVKEDGSIQVSITWERRRWYWTSRREIAFVGQQSPRTDTVSLMDVRQALGSIVVDNNPMCARF